MKKVYIADITSKTGKQLKEFFLKADCMVLGGGFKKEDCFNSDTFYMDILSQETILNAAKEVSKIVDSLDILVLNIDFTEPDETTASGRHDYDALIKAYQTDTIGTMLITNAFLPLMEKGELKRICYLTTKQASNNCCKDTKDYASHITKAAINMQSSLLFNQLHPLGYTFRMMCVDDNGNADAFTVDYFIRNRCYEEWDPKHSDENRFVLRDAYGCEMPW